MVDSILHFNDPSFSGGGLFTNGGQIKQAAARAGITSSDDSGGLFDKFSMSAGEATGVGLDALGTALQNISSYQAARRNFKTMWSNARETFNTLEYNVGVQRRNNAQAFAQNRVAINASGISSKSFTDVQRSNQIVAEDDIAAMREQVRRSVYSQLSEAAKQKKRAGQAALWGTVGTIAGVSIGAATGNPFAAVVGANVGGKLGSAAGGE